MASPLKKSTTRATGVPVPLLPPSGGSSSAGGMSLRIGDLPVPSRRFLANAVDVVIDSDGSVQLLFGQRRAVGTGLRMLLVARSMPVHITAFMATTDAFVASIQAFLNEASVLPTERYSCSEEPIEAVEVQFTIVAAVFAGADASLDLYYVSPWAIHEFRQAGGSLKETSVEPIVRIQLPTQVLATVLALLKPFAGAGHEA